MSGSHKYFFNYIFKIIIKIKTLQILNSNGNTNKCWIVPKNTRVKKNTKDLCQWIYHNFCWNSEEFWRNNKEFQYIFFLDAILIRRKIIGCTCAKEIIYMDCKSCVKYRVTSFRNGSTVLLRIYLQCTNTYYDNIYGIINRVN